MLDRSRLTSALAAAAVLVVGGAVAGEAPASGTSTRYRVAASLQPSTVLVGHRITVTGTVAPRASQSRVKLQVLTDGAWRTVTVSVLTRRSHYVAAYTPPAAGTYRLRVRKPAADGHRRGTSTTMVLTVTPSLPPV